MAKSIVVSGIQPTGRLHVGNYLGSLKNFVALQRENVCFFFIADYHSLTEDYDPRQRPRQILSLAVDYLAAGLDPKVCTLFAQSAVSQHTELAWIFNCVTPLGHLRRMTQFKDKAARQPDNVNVGLFNYPVLQSADILVYRGSRVPVGVDQLQHLELTREIARFFNKRFGQTFPEPQPLLTMTPSVKSLKDPAKKMSKSLGDDHCLYLDDAPETIVKKLKAAPSATGTEPFLAELAELVATEGAAPRRSDADRFGAAPTDDPLLDGLRAKYREADEKSLRGARNLFTFYAAFIGQGKPVTNFRFAALKQQIAEAIAEHLRPYRQRRAELLDDLGQVQRVLDDGAAHARNVAEKTMRDARQRVGLLVTAAE